MLRVANAGGSGTTVDSIVDPAGDRLGTRAGTTVAWLLPDLHGSVAGATDQAESVVTDALRYDGYGMTAATWPTGGSAATANWKYQGRLDLSPTTTSLYDFAAREYSPGLGTFTSLDSVLGSAQNPGQLNRYLYAAADPATLIDPDGHCTYGQDWFCTFVSNVPFVGPAVASAYLPDNAVSGLGHAVAPYDSSTAMALGFVDRAGQITSDTATGVGGMASGAVRYQFDPAFHAQTDQANGAAIRGLVADPVGAGRSAASSAAFAAANWVGSMQRQLTSDDPVVRGSAVADVTSVADSAASFGMATVGLVRGGLRTMGRTGPGLLEDANQIPKGGVYTLREPLTDTVVRTGRTIDFVRRQIEHAADPILGKFLFRTEYLTDVYAEQRGLEDVLYNRHPEAKAINGGYNRIWALSPANRLYADYVRAAYHYLDRRGI